MSESAQHERMLHAVTVIADLVHTRNGRLAQSLDEVAATACACRDRELPGLEAHTLGGRIDPIDPSDLKATALQILGYQGEEIRWTRWLCGILEGRGGAKARGVLASALRDIVVKADPGVAEVWQSESEHITGVRAEVRTATGEQLDLVVSTKTCLIVVENKLFGGWNDGPGSSQADTYVDAARALQADAKLPYIVLVVLTMGDAVRDHARWTKVRYASLARRLRSLLHEHLPRDAGIAQYLELAPIFELVREIENVAKATGLHRDASLWKRYLHLRANVLDAQENE